MSSVGWDRRGVSWMVCWMTLASVASGVMKRRPIRKMISRCTPTKTPMTACGMPNFASLSLKKISHIMKQ
jgi:hypothetical protein